MHTAQTNWMIKLEARSFEAFNSEAQPLNHDNIVEPGIVMSVLRLAIRALHGSSEENVLAQT